MNKIMKVNYISLLVLLLSTNCVQAVGDDEGKEALNNFVNFTRNQGINYMFSNKTMNIAWLQHALSLRMNGMPLTLENKNAVQGDLLKAVEGLFNYFPLNPALGADDLNKLRRVLYNIARYQIDDFMLKQPLGIVPVRRARPYADQPASASSSRLASTVTSVRPVSGQSGVSNQIYDTKTQRIQENGIRQLIARIKAENPRFTDYQVSEAVYKQAANIIAELKNIPSLDRYDYSTNNDLLLMINRLNNPSYKAPMPQVFESTPSYLPFKIYNAGSRRLEEEGIRRLIYEVKTENPQFDDEQLAQATYNKAVPVIAAQKKINTLDKNTADELMFTIKFILRTPNIRF